MKTHYGSCQRANESDNQDHWSKTSCGLEYTESPMTDKPKEITCKSCLKIYNKHLQMFKDKHNLNTSPSFGGMGMGTF